jgi:hypothetical protein
MQAKTVPNTHTQYALYIPVSTVSQTPDFEIQAEGSCQNQISRLEKYIRENLKIHFPCALSLSPPTPPPSPSLHCTANAHYRSIFAGQWKVASILFKGY